MDARSCKKLNWIWSVALSFICNLRWYSDNVTTSLIIAEIFGKRHDAVLRDIQNLDCPSDFNLHNFGEISYTDSMNREQRAYEMTKDGFSFLVMGYTGAKAAKFKVDFINEFNRRWEDKWIKLKTFTAQNRAVLLHKFKHLFVY